MIVKFHQWNCTSNYGQSNVSESDDLVISGCCLHAHNDGWSECVQCSVQLSRYAAARQLNNRFDSGDIGHGTHLPVLWVGG